MLKGAGGEVEKETLWGMAEVRKKEVFAVRCG